LNYVEKKISKPDKQKKINKEDIFFAKKTLQQEYNRLMEQQKLFEERVKLAQQDLEFQEKKLKQDAEKLQLEQKKIQHEKELINKSDKKNQ